MLSLFIRALLLASGVITGWFVARDAHQFGIMQMMVAVLLFVIGIAIAAFWPALLRRIKNRANRQQS